MDVALLGGSFNPPHVGHLLAAHVVRALEPVDQVWFVPAAHHPFGKPLIDFAHRLAMCELMCRDASGWLAASDVEGSLGGNGYTVDTLRELHGARRTGAGRWSSGATSSPSSPSGTSRRRSAIWPASWS